jgi:protease-4
MSDPIIDPAHALPAASALRRSRFRWRILAFVALVVAILAGAGRYATETGLSGDQIARIVIDGTIATDRIFARRLSIVASIGVLFQTYNAGKLMETIGIGSDKVASGPLKAEPSIDHPMTPEVRASLQSLVDDSFSWFVDIVAERRGLTRAQVLPLADGRVMTGNQGLAAKLIDEIGAESEAVAWLESDKGLAHDLPVSTAYPPPDTGEPWFWRLIGGEMRGLLGLPAQGPIALDGLVSLWQGQPSL